MGCHWCDVKESWDAQKHPPTPVEDIVKEAVKFSDTIVITGGEPLMWDMEPLTFLLKQKYKNPYRNLRGLSFERTLGLDLSFSQKKYVAQRRDLLQSTRTQGDSV